MPKDKAILWNIISLVILGISGVTINSLILIFKGEEAVGIFNQTYAIYIVLSQIGVAGIQYSVLNRLSLTTEDLITSGRITGGALLLVLIFSGLVSWIGWRLAPWAGDLLKSGDVSRSLGLIMPGLAFFCLNKVLINVINAFERMIAYAVIRSARFILIPILIGIVILFDLENQYLALSITITEILLFIVLLIYISSAMFRIRFPNAKSFFLEHLNYSVRGFFSGVMMELNTRLDVLILGYFVSDYSVGVYSFVAALAEGFSQFSYALRWNIDPQLGRFLAVNDHRSIRKLVVSLRKQYYLYFVMGGVLLIGAYPFAFRLLNGSYDLVSAGLFTIMMAGVIIGSWYRPFSGMILQGGKPGVYTLYILALLVGDGLLNIILIPYLGILGAALVTMLTYLLEGYYLKLISIRLFSVQL